MQQLQPHFLGKNQLQRSLKMLTGDGRVPTRQKPCSLHFLSLSLLLILAALYSSAVRTMAADNMLLLLLLFFLAKLFY